MPWSKKIGNFKWLEIFNEKNNMRLITSTIFIINVHVYISELSHICRILIKKVYTEYPRLPIRLNKHFSACICNKQISKFNGLNEQIHGSKCL